jgi:hypothetical protein
MEAPNEGWLRAENEFQAKRGALSTPFRKWEGKWDTIQPAQD